MSWQPLIDPSPTSPTFGLSPYGYSIPAPSPTYYPSISSVQYVPQGPQQDLSITFITHSYSGQRVYPFSSAVVPTQQTSYPLAPTDSNSAPMARQQYKCQPQMSVMQYQPQFANMTYDQYPSRSIRRRWGTSYDHRDHQDWFCGCDKDWFCGCGTVL